MDSVKLYGNMIQVKVGALKDNGALRNELKGAFPGTHWNHNNKSWDVPVNVGNIEQIKAWFGSKGVVIGDGYQAQQNSTPAPSAGAGSKDGDSVVLAGDMIHAKIALMKGNDALKNELKGAFPGTHWNNYEYCWNIPVTVANVEQVKGWFASRGIVVGAAYHQPTKQNSAHLTITLNPAQVASLAQMAHASPNGLTLSFSA